MQFLYSAEFKCFRLKIFTTCLLLAGIYSISHAAPTESEVLKSLTEEGIYPNLFISSSGARQLTVAVKQLCKNPDSENLKKARDAWKNAYLAWCRAEPFMFGPIDKPEQHIAKWPANRVVLDAVAASSDYRNMADKTDVRGFPAVEHLLFAPRDAAEATSGERCVHLISVTEEIEEIIQKAEDEWKNGFGEKFMSAGDGNPYLIPGDALSLAVARILNLTEDMLLNRIGMTGVFRQTKPEDMEAWRSGATLEGFKATIEGIGIALKGSGDSCIIRLIATKDGLVESKDPALAADILKQLDRIEKTIETLEDGNNIFNKPGKLKGLYKQVQVLQDQFIEAALVLELDVRSSEEQVSD